MKHTEISVFDEKEEHIITMLENCGMNRSTAKILMCISIREEACSRDIEIMTGIKSSTVSVILKQLREDGFIKASKKQDENTKRIILYYSISGSMGDVLSKLAERKIKETNTYIEKIKKIKHKTG
jgi:predicted transcriptional regulator